jgi:protein phosphatase
MSRIPIHAAGRSDVGRRRPHNEDAFLIDEELGLYVVADGVGGNAMGEVASQESVDQIRGFVSQGRAAIERFRAERNDPSRQGVRRLMESAVQNACYMVFGMAEFEPSQRGMSTTLSALLIVDDHAFIAQVGDSRIYRIRGGKTEQLTEDHTLVNLKVKQGLLTPEQAVHAKGKNVLTRAVGHKDHVQVDTLVLEVRGGDQFVLCSDGLHGYLQPGELELHVSRNLDESAKRLIDLANSRGGKDNITAVVVAAESDFEG